MNQMTKTRKEKKEETHKKLVDAALKHFRLDGLSGARTIDIANTAGVSHGTVFLHFPTREELLISVMYDFGTRVTRQMRANIDSKMGIKSVLETHVNVLSQYEDIYIRLISEVSSLPEELQIVVVSIHAAISHTMFIAVKNEMESGKIKKLEMEFLFTTWIGLLHHYLQNKKYYSPNKSLLESRGGRLVDHYMNLITERK